MENERIDLLQRTGAPPVLLEIARGESRPPLTDYEVLPIPDEWDSPLPSEMVDGRELVPVFCDADEYTLYCVDRGTLEILTLDVEEPWPPLNIFASWSVLVAEIIRVYDENDADAAQRARELFAGNRA